MDFLPLLKNENVDKASNVTLKESLALVNGIQSSKIIIQDLRRKLKKPLKL